jgi:hypothetical protein
MRTILILVAATASFLVSTTAGHGGDRAVHRDGSDRCDVRREVAAELPAEAVRGLLISAAAGTLQVRGDDGATVRVRGVICASDTDLADDARLVVEARREVAWIEADLPEQGGWGDDYVRMDLEVLAPAVLPADIRDSSGDLEVRGIAAVRIEDSSGGIEVREVAGAVEIDDSSGGIAVYDVGSVQLRDGSGGVVVQGVRENVRVLDDGSGPMDIEDVGGDVRIDEDGSGGIRIERVVGDVVVLRDGSGGIDVREVQGEVRIPDRR